MASKPNHASSLTRTCGSCGSLNPPNAAFCGDCGRRLWPNWAAFLLLIGPLGLFLTASAFGVLEVHSSTDTWIGLAGGRQIVEQTTWWPPSELRKTFPINDTFSFTFNGHRWFNQNWGPHVLQYLLWDNFSPAAVVYGTWAMAGSVFLFVALGAYWRSGSWMGALIAGAAVGIGCRDFLSPRPATTGFFCMAALWALLCAIEGQRGKIRRWPIMLLVPLLVFWGQSHGSFVFAYAIIAMYIGNWIVVRVRSNRIGSIASLVVPLIVLTMIIVSEKSLLFFDDPPELRWVLLPIYTIYWAAVTWLKPNNSARIGQVLAIGGVCVVTLCLTMYLSPYGMDHLTHGDKIAGSKIFRQVSEWQPPYQNLRRSFPPMYRFWWILGCTTLLMLSVWVLSVFSALFGASKSKAQVAPVMGLHTSYFDVAMVLISLSMTLWARRFAPMLYIFASPVLLTWIILMMRPVGPALRSWLRIGLFVATLIGACVTGLITQTRAQRALVTRYEKDHPDFNLLERVARYDIVPHDAFVYLVENELEVNLLAEWTQAGRAMFFARKAKVFIDGRAQQVYDEKHYRAYLKLSNPQTAREDILKTLAQFGTDTVLIKLYPQFHGPSLTTRNLWRTLSSTRDWSMIMYDDDYAIFMRRGSPPMLQVGRMTRNGTERRPDTPEALATRGLVLVNTAPLNLEYALKLWRQAVDRKLSIGILCYRLMTRVMVKLGRSDEARRFINEQSQRFHAERATLDEIQRKQIQAELAACQRELQRRPAPAGQRQRSRP